MNASIARRRLHNQRINRAARGKPADVVAWLGAVQAQEYPAARWALGVRHRGTTDAEIARAFDEGHILRTHVLRPTWHFVTPKDIRWLLELTAPHVKRVLAGYCRRLALEGAVLTRAVRVIERALEDGGYLTRAELAVSLQRAGLALEGQHLASAVMAAEQDAIICSGPRKDGQFTYALLEKRAPSACRLSRDEALAELARRYFSSHGPATIRDFVWWSGLKASDAGRALDIIGARQERIDGLTYWTTRRSGAGDGPAAAHLLPVYDEYLVAYRDRTAVPHRPSLVESGASGGAAFQHTLVIDGQVAGTWRASRTARGVALHVYALRRLTRREADAVLESAARYEQFLGVPLAPAVHR